MPIFDACFIIETLNDKDKTNSVANIAKKLGIAIIAPLKISNISKEQLMRAGDIVPGNANMKSNDLNNLVKFDGEKRMMTYQEIKHYLEHRTAWNIMFEKKMERVLVIDNSVELKREFQENFTKKIIEILVNVPPLYSIISLGERSPSKENAFRCNEFFNYPKVADKTHLAYIINNLGIKKMLTQLPLTPIRGPIGNLINEVRTIKKDIYAMKYPIFNLPENSYIKREQQPLKQLSLPVKQVENMFKKVFIITGNNFKNESISESNIITAVMENEEEVWKAVTEEDNNDDVLILNNTINLNMKELEMHLGLIGKEVPENYNFIGLSSKENNIKHPFRFSANLDFVHPDMHDFSGYLLSKKGALMLLKNKEHKNRNLMLSREHYCFAYNKKIFEVICD